MTGDGVIDLTPEGSEHTLPIPPRALAVAPEPSPPPADDGTADDEVEVATVELRGRAFPVRPQGVGLITLMEFATLAKSGKIDSEDMEGLAALLRLLKGCIDSSVWREFADYADETGAKGEELIGVVRGAIQAMTARPTRQPSLSPGGQPGTVPSSAGGSSSPGSSVPMGSVAVQRRYEEAGRPDIAQAVKRAREASTTSSTG